jgi:hypothetical protein
MAEQKDIDGKRYSKINGEIGTQRYPNPFQNAKKDDEED